ncbi:MAG: DEAD/DEAH box helicase family protein [Chloroflexi bacterium]|nr:DEAD/DEAH box helicase family protein [Chloroflexota bacterium]
MTTPSSNEPVLIQPVESPVICKPYYEPTDHYEYDRTTGRANKLPGRRPDAYWYKLSNEEVRQHGARQGKLALRLKQPTGDEIRFELDEGRRDLVLVNRLREDVKRWRNANWEGATNVTKDLLRHWGRKDRARRLFFCQLEAAETVIFLNEIRGLRRDGKRGKPRWEPKFTDADFEKLFDVPADPGYSPLPRMACKMATGSGKTVVMAILLAWAFCNRGRTPSDDRFPNAALVCCPNLTMIKERLQVLRTDNRGNDYYTEFELVPPQYHDLLRAGKVLVTNWHYFAPESEHSEGDRSYAVVQKGQETDEAFARRRLGELFERGPIMVFNDEGHHAYRPAPLSEKEARTTDAEVKKEREQATVWVQGLDRISRACGVRFCLDLSATPFYIAGSGYPEGEPFPWIVSDFGLVDAIESGITKIPRLPVSDTTGQPDPKYFRLWRNITRNLAPAQRLSTGRPKPEVVWERAEDALVQLAGEYKAKFESIRQASDTALKAPPVMIVVCDNTDIAAVFFENISGQSEVEEILEEDDDEKEATPRPKRPKMRVSYGASKTSFPELFQNDQGRLWTIRIDSKRLEKVESEHPDATRDEAAKELREIVNTVGKSGKPGQDVRCVVSVAMLTEGWDASNVTHILGVRAFDRQLLCEQVVGRGLRRMNYTPDPATELFPEEYVDVYGIPFSVIPYKGKTGRPPPDKPVNHVFALPERAAYELRFPNVEGYVYALQRPSVKADFSTLERLVVEPEQTPTATFLRIITDHLEGGAHGGGMGEFVEHNRAQYYAQNHPQGIEFEIARHVVAALVGEGPQAPVRGSARMRGRARHELFPQVLRIVRRYVREKVDFRGVNPCELGLEKYVRRIKERLLEAILPDEQQGETPILPVLNKYLPVGRTSHINFTTKRNVHSTQRSHVNAVVLDSTWEQTAAFYLEQQTDHVFCYVRNDRPFLLIPYEYEGVAHRYEPDYLVRLKGGKMLVLEIKGEEDDQDRAKHQAARRWTMAVNNWARLGRWEFAVCRDAQTLPRLISGMT